MNLRNDIGKLWENYIIGERLKYQESNRQMVNNYFWRNYNKQEIDWVEERNGDLIAYEFKWSSKKIPKAPTGWTKVYPHATFEVINSDNYFSWVNGTQLNISGI